MSLKELIAEIAELCEHEELATGFVDLSLFRIEKAHSSIKPYFEECVPSHGIDGPFYQLHSASDLAELHAEYTPACQIVPFGFVAFASEHNGDAVAVDSNDGRVYLVSHEIYSYDGTMDSESGDSIPITRESILATSENLFSSIQSFFESWRKQLIELQGKRNEFLDAATDDPNATDKFGNALIHHYIQEGDLKKVKHEVKRGVNLEQFNCEGRTPLGEAVAFESPRIVKFLIKCGADVNASNDSGETPLMIAAFYAQLKCIKILLKAGASRSDKDSEGRTAAERLCQIHGTPVMEKLLAP